MQKAKIGLIGLAVMGANLSRNIANNKIPIVVFNRTTEKTTDFIKEFGNEFLKGSESLEEFVEKIEKPRNIGIMVKSGTPVDTVIQQLIPLLDKGDVIIDFGNSHYRDSERRSKELEEKGLHFVGCGVSGGEEGALHGPSIMPGGSAQSWENLKEILEPIAAKDFDGKPCVAYIGPAAAGHFVKMAHNGIEYGIMQILAESYHILKVLGGLSNEELSKFYADLNEERAMKSFLLEITSKIFLKKEDGKDVIDLIKSVAGAKGTGRWTTESALNYGVAIPTISAAVDARIISSNEELRSVIPKFEEEIKQKAEIIPSIKDAIELSIIIAYLQGFELLRVASLEENWNLDTNEISRIWQGGCIIRSSVLQDINAAIQQLYSKEKQGNWRKSIMSAVGSGIPFSAISNSLSYFDSMLTIRLPQNLTQAQRDFFGAHTYERIDKEGTFHTEWE